jgi:hypothetical protein
LLSSTSLAKTTVALAKHRPDGVAYKRLTSVERKYTVKKQQHWQDWVNLLLGIWVFLSP